MDPITLRAIERLLAVSIGGLSIFLGYHLFLRIPHLSEGEGKISFANGVSVHLARVGPGVFFALFGAAVVGLALYRSVSFETLERSRVTAAPRAPAITAQAETRTSYSGFGQRVATDPQLDRLALQEDLRFLNRLPRALRDDLDAASRRALARHPERIKLRLMEGRWSPDWGDRDAFRDWVERGAQDPVPQGLDAAAALFRSDQEG